MRYTTRDLRTALFGVTDIFSGYTPALPLDDQGWGQTSLAFDELLPGRSIRSVLEIGTWKGASAIRMAQMLPGSELCCVDTWLGQLEFLSAEGEFGGILRPEFGHPRVYEQFLANIHHTGLEDRITPLAQTSALACKWLHQNGFRFDAVYVDGSHEYPDVVSDVEWSCLLVNPGGLVFGDDYEWQGVRQAVSENEHPHTVCHDKWVIEMPA